MDNVKPHKNAVIAIKMLSDADMGLSAKSNQTHIGIYENTLYCIDDLHMVRSCLFVAEQKSKTLLCLLDYIENPDGTFRSPKIRKGSNEEMTYQGREMNSVVREIREIVKSGQKIKKWYLLWFVDESERLVFVLFEFRSELFDLLSAKLDGVKQRQQFEFNSEAFYKIINTISPYLNNEL